MGGSGAAPYLVGVALGHFGTVLGWLLTESLQHLNRTSVTTSSSTITSTLTTTSTDLLNFGSSKGGKKWFGGSDFGEETIALWVLAILSWCVSCVLAAFLCRNHFGQRIEVEPASPSLRALAQAQLAEVRLRRHGIAKSDGSSGV